MHLNVTLINWQHDFMRSSATIKALAGGSDTGKSFVSRLHQITTCLNYPNSYHFATATTHTQTFRAIFEPMTEFMVDHNIDHLATVKKGEGLLEFYNGSRIEIFSSDKMYHRLRSREFSTGFIEEASTIPDKDFEKIFYESIRRLRQPNVPHHLLLATNPDVKTRWIYQNLFENPPENSFVLKEIPFWMGYNWNDKERESKILMGSKREKEFFYYGKWGNPEGVAFILEDGIHVKPIDSNELEQFFISFDYGFSPDPMVYILASYRNGVIFIIDEIVLSSIPVNRHEAYLEKWYEKYNIVGYTGETAAGSGEIRDLLNSRRLSYYATTKKRSQGWTTIADLVDQKRIVIDPRCKHVIRSLGCQMWVGSTQGVDCQGEYDDPADAVRYFVMCSYIYTHVIRREKEGKQIRVIGG